MATVAEIRREFGTPVDAPLASPSPDDIRNQFGVPGGQPWTFTQLGGAKKSIILTGWAAPFGRPRKSTVANLALEVRQVERRYPGNDKPTRHLFGVRWDDVELNGRWMDSWGGRGFAKKQTEAVYSFINDQQPVRITWADALSFTGLLLRLDAESEGPADVKWKLKIAVDGNDALSPTLGPVPQPKSPGSLVNQMIEAMSDASQAALTTPPILKPSLFDFLDSIIGIINAPGEALLSFSQDVDSFRKATFSELARFRAVLQQYRQAIDQFRSTYETAQVDAAIEFARSDEELQLYRQQAFFGVTMAEALQQIVAADDAAARALRSRTKLIITAVEGDTWESISVRGYGTADRANDIRDANNIAAGEQPKPGGDYILPV